MLNNVSDIYIIIYVYYDLTDITDVKQIYIYVYVGAHECIYFLFLIFLNKYTGYIYIYIIMNTFRIFKNQGKTKKNQETKIYYICALTELVSISNWKECRCININTIILMQNALIQPNWKWYSQVCDGCIKRHFRHIVWTALNSEINYCDDFRTC